MVSKTALFWPSAAPQIRLIWCFGIFWDVTLLIGAKRWCYMPVHIFWLYYLSKLSMFSLENRFLWRGASGRTKKKVIEIWKITILPENARTSLHSRNQLRAWTAGLENCAWGRDDCRQVLGKATKTVNKSCWQCRNILNPVSYFDSFCK